MSRHITRAGADRLTFSLGAMTTFPFGTMAMVFRLLTNHGGGTYPTLVGTDASGDDAFSFFLDGDNGMRPSTYNGTGGAVCGAAGMPIAVADGWVFTAMTKATGTVAPRFHRYRWSANDWVHAASGTTTPNPALTVSAIKVGQNHLNNEGGDLDLVAALIASNYVMTDSEIERLPWGLWDRWVDQVKPGFLWEAGDRDQPIAGSGRDSSRSGARESALTATTRGAAMGPPGFRFSRLNRRR